MQQNCINDLMPLLAVSLTTEAQSPAPTHHNKFTVYEKVAVKS
jgi:hypothetical protein